MRFLVNENDYRSYLLRKYFQFCLIPIINPEGVFEGMFRNDLNGDNLNRMYLHCNRNKQYNIIYSANLYGESRVGRPRLTELISFSIFTLIPQEKDSLSMEMPLKSLLSKCRHRFSARCFSTTAPTFKTWTAFTPRKP